MKSDQPDTLQQQQSQAGQERKLRKPTVGSSSSSSCSSSASSGPSGAKQRSGGPGGGAGGAFGRGPLGALGSGQQGHPYRVYRQDIEHRGRSFSLDQASHTRRQSHRYPALHALHSALRSAAQRARVRRAPAKSRVGNPPCRPAARADLPSTWRALPAHREVLHADWLAPTPAPFADWLAGPLGPVGLLSLARAARCPADVAHRAREPGPAAPAAGVPAERRGAAQRRIVHQEDHGLLGHQPHGAAAADRPREPGGCRAQQVYSLVVRLFGGIFSLFPTV